MKKTVMVAALAVVALVACNKEEETTSDSQMIEEVASEDATVTVSSSNYAMEILEPLVQTAEHEAYSDGKIAYLEDGEATTTIEFEEGEDGRGHCMRHRDSLGMDRPNMRPPRDGGKFTKVIVNPLVKSLECDYIVAGTIELFDGDVWVATIDFGDGTCDILATKTTADGVHDIDLSKRFEKKPKGGKPKGPKMEE